LKTTRLPPARPPRPPIEKRRPPSEAEHGPQGHPSTRANGGGRGRNPVVAQARLRGASYGAAGQPLQSGWPAAAPRGRLFCNSSSQRRSAKKKRNAAAKPQRPRRRRSCAGGRPMFHTPNIYQAEGLVETSPRKLCRGNTNIDCAGIAPTQPTQVKPQKKGNNKSSISG
jgi:hypothetical protein